MKRQQKKQRRRHGRPEAPNEKASATARNQQGSKTLPDQDLLRRLDAAGVALERIEAGDAPTAAELAAAPRLDFWCVAEDGLFPILQGVVSGHPHLYDGAFVATSPLIWIADDASAARTLSRFYRLGPPIQEGSQECN